MSVKSSQMQLDGYQMNSEKSSLAQLATPSGSSENVRSEGAIVQPEVKEQQQYADEKEKRLAEFVFGMQKKRADANGTEASKGKEKLISSLTQESEMVCWPPNTRVYIGGGANKDWREWNLFQERGELFHGTFPSSLSLSDHQAADDREVVTLRSKQVHELAELKLLQEQKINDM